MKLIIDIPEEIYTASQTIEVKHEYIIRIPLEIVANGTPFDSVIENREKAETKAYFDGQAYGWEQGRKALIEDIKAEIEHVIDNTYDSTDYDKSLYNGAYKDGLYDALDIIDKHISGKENE